MTSRIGLRRQSRYRPLKIALHVLTMSVIGGVAYAGGMPVIDSSNLTQNTATAIKMIEQVKQAIEQVKQLTSLNGAVGAAKQSVNASLPGWNSSITSNVSAVKPNFDTWQLPKDIAPSIGNPGQAQQFIAKVMDFPAPKPGKESTPRTGEEFKKLQDQRFKVQKEVAFRAMGAAEAAISSAPEASQTANSIVSAPNNDLRMQTAQLIQAVVSVNQELIQQRVLMAQLLELQAATTIKGFPTTTMEQVAGGKAGGGASSGITDPFQ
jgi:hypothetical protein